MFETPPASISITCPWISILRFKLLIIPLAGLSMLFILISGLYLYWVAYRKKRPVRVKEAKIGDVVGEPVEVLVEK